MIVLFCFNTADLKLKPFSVKKVTWLLCLLVSMHVNLYAQGNMQKLVFDPVDPFEINGIASQKPGTLSFLRSQPLFSVLVDSVRLFSCKEARLAGDTLFSGSIGRTDLPGGNMNTILNSIRNKILVLPDATKVYSGHGPATTVGSEKLNNPYLA